MIWRKKHALTCRAALLTYSIGMRVLHTRAHTSSQHTYSVLMGTCGQQTQVMVSGATFLTALLSLGSKKLSLASIYCCRCCCYCCWRKGKFNWLHFFFLSTPRSSAPLRRSQFSPYRLRNAACDRTEKTWKHFGIAAFYSTWGSLQGAFLGQSPPHRVSCALVWPCGVSPGSTFRLAFRTKLSRLFYFI